MCSICGEIRFDNTTGTLASVEVIVKTLIPRGSDAAGAHLQGAVAWGPIKRLMEKG